MYCSIFYYFDFKSAASQTISIIDKRENSMQKEKKGRERGKARARWRPRCKTPLLFCVCLVNSTCQR